jgi:hypothetical protein
VPSEAAPRRVTLDRPVPTPFEFADQMHACQVPYHHKKPDLLRKDITRGILLMLAALPRVCPGALTIPQSDLALLDKCCSKIDQAEHSIALYQPLGYHALVRGHLLM